MTLAGLLVLTTSSQAVVSFSFNYTDASNVGFNDNVQGASRRAGLEEAGRHRR